MIKNKNISLFIKVFIILVFLGFILPFIIELLLRSFFSPNGKTPRGSSLYVFFNYGRGKTLYDTFLNFVYAFTL